MKKDIGTYREVETLGKSQLDLILMVYDGAIKTYQEARECIRNGQLTAGREKLEKAKKFVVHLYTTLNKEKGGEVAENLGRLYTFVISMTDVVSGSKELDKIDSIIKILSNLREGWTSLKDQNKKDNKQPSENQTEIENKQFSVSI